SGDFIFRTAMVDGTFDKTDTLLQSSAAGKSYKYYSFGVGDVYPEPNREEWDLLFTRYYALTTPPGGGTAVMYPTMGVESKRGTRVAKVTDYNWDMIASSPSQAIAGIKIPGTPSELNKDLTRIGGDWKAFNNATGRWTIQTNWNYVIESVRNITGRADTAYYMLSFTGFTGSSRGESQFRKLLLTPTASARTETKQIEVKLFPNPVQNNLMIWAPDFKALSTVNIVAADGRIVSQKTIDFSAETSVNLDVTGLAQGSYWLQINSDKDRVNLPFIKH
ncbi:MAG: T9SS type A sorting domain-containing protein, partial [Planctomycetes bacterium]|nr:T9SS type A sorting domain-containing protein [Planctomycetota bacterium]